MRNIEKSLILIIWIPFTLGILFFFIGDLLWAFGNTCLITDYYTERFNGPIECNTWLIKQLGIIGILFGIVLIICYCKLTIYLFKK